MSALLKNRVYRFAEFQLHADEHLLLRGDERVWLSPRNFNLLVKLVENAGHLLTKETLVNEVWEGSFVEEGNLNRTISNLRKALGEKPNENRFIETIPRVGYRFVAPVELVTNDAALAESAAMASDVLPETGGNTEAVLAAEGETQWKSTLPGITGRLLRRRPLALALVLVVIAVFGLYLWRIRGPGAAVVPAETDRYAPVALSHATTEDGVARWTKDGRVRFNRVYANRKTESWIMNADGTNQVQAGDFPNLQWGVWSPDDQKVIFGKADDRLRLYLANADGSNEVALPFGVTNLDWSPDSKQIVYQESVDSNSEIFVYSLETRESKNISNNPAFDADPSFSPDGKQITFVSGRDGNAEIYVMSIDGGNVKRLTDNPAVDTHPAFSPDGTQILFSSDREKEHSDVYIMNANGSGEPVNLINWEKSSQYAGPGSWSPDGTKILFMSNQTGKDGIYIMSAEAFRPQKILMDAHNELGSPAYSPDGKSIAYQVQLEDKSGELHIWNLETNRDSLVIRTKNADLAPAWSPSGQWIAFRNRVEDNTEICLIRPDGSGLKNLTQNPAADVAPSWSPDGRQIAFVSNRDGNYELFQIYVMDAGGSNQHRVYYSQATSGWPSWSPDGRSIVFANDKEDNRSGNFEIFIIEPDTGEPERRLTFRRRYDVSPVFSPSGKRIAFASNTDGNHEIYVMNADGTGLLRLTRDAADDSAPHWSPDETKIVFSSNREGRFALYELAVPR